MTRPPIDPLPTPLCERRTPDALLVAKTAELSPRETEIGLLVAEGLSNKEIGLVLDISPWTVATHLKRIYAKLDLHRRTALAALVSSAPIDAIPTRARSMG
ncbi:MAG: helix-turn-helix transcriptional regulator [Erythrobacter sp.]|jgi:DNA-binding CsgD family transcriptional regulator|nr:helix-turn-helix transcriptional regulator [Erythrobacter sp.]